MKTIKVYEVGDRVEFERFSYINKAGGTGSANADPITSMDTKFTGTASGEIIHAFHDEECGWRFHIKLDEKYWDMIKGRAQENKAFVSEWGINNE